MAGWAYLHKCAHIIGNFCSQVLQMPQHEHTVRTEGWWHIQNRAHFLLRQTFNPYPSSGRVRHLKELTHLSWSARLMLWYRGLDHDHTLPPQPRRLSSNFRYSRPHVFNNAFAGNQTCILPTLWLQVVRVTLDHSGVVAKTLRALGVAH